jgi:hypothetical protein
VSLSRDSYAFGADEYGSLFVGELEGEAPTPFAPDQGVFQGLYSFSARSWISRWEKARLSFGASLGDTPIFTSGVPADVAERRSGDVSLTLYPTGSLSMNLALRHVSLFRKLDGSLYSRATSPRLQTTYQFSRSLYIRGIGEYSSQTRGDVRDPLTGSPVFSCGTTCTPKSGSDAHDFRLEGLLGYEPSPGTVLYVGYSRQLRDTEAFRFRDFTPRNDGLFVKVSYRFRM